MPHFARFSTFMYRVFAMLAILLAPVVAVSQEPSTASKDVVGTWVAQPKLNQEFFKNVPKDQQVEIEKVIEGIKGNVFCFRFKADGTATLMASDVAPTLKQQIAAKWSVELATDTSIEVSLKLGKTSDPVSIARKDPPEFRMPKGAGPALFPEWIDVVFIKQSKEVEEATKRHVGTWDFTQTPDAEWLKTQPEEARDFLTRQYARAGGTETYKDDFTFEGSSEAGGAYYGTWVVVGVDKSDKSKVQIQKSILLDSLVLADPTNATKPMVITPTFVITDERSMSVAPGVKDLQRVWTKFSKRTEK